MLKKIFFLLIGLIVLGFIVMSFIKVPAPQHEESKVISLKPQ